MKNRNKLIMVLCLSCPLIVFYLGYFFNHASSLSATGFIQYDNVSYVAYGRQYLDADSFHIQYSNPFNDSSYNTIYFQPQTILFALLLKIGVPPGFILIPFTWICSLVCFWLIISIYDHISVKKNFRALSIWLFAWGGGLLTFTSAITYSYLYPGSHFSDGIFVLDPEHGWWGLNLGRSLFFTCEAYYHALFLGTIFFLLMQKWIASSVLMLILLFSHPFSSIELIGIVCFWILIETILNKRAIPWWFTFASVCYMVVYIYYYLIYLNQFPDHRSVADQYSLNWRLRYYRIIPAYCMVGILAAVAIYKETIQKFFQNRANRLFACWLIVAFLLANHELFIKPRQPIHFTRGYIWTSLFLLGLPALQQLHAYLKFRLGKISLILFAAIFFSDNISWILFHVASKKNQPSPLYITPEQNKVFNLLKAETNNHTLLISNDENISYLSTIYTKVYPWLSHPFTTPFAAEKRAAYNAFLQNGKIDSSWLGRNIVFVMKKNNTPENVQAVLNRMNIDKRKETDNYIIAMSDSLHFKN